MTKKTIIVALCALAGTLASCSKMANNDPWAIQHQKSRNKVMFPVG